MSAVARNPVTPVNDNPPHPEHVVACARAADLSAIHESGINLALWERPVPDMLKGWLDGLDDGHLPHAVIEACPRAVLTELAEIATHDWMDPDEAEMHPGMQFLIYDLAKLAGLFARVAHLDAVRLQLRATGDETRDVWAADHRSLRMICSFRGEGTLWLPNSAVERKKLEAGLPGGICRKTASVRQLPRFCAGLFKGEGAPGNAGNGIIHRAPVRHEGQPARLVAVIDAL